MGLKNNVMFYIILILVTVFAGSSSYAMLRNYDNDPDLAKAMEYDYELNRGDEDVADRSLAEEYYLKYLEKLDKPKESFQRALVYSRLGALYAVAINEAKGEKPDYEKAAFYLKKVLEEEPERYSGETARSRSLLIDILYRHDPRQHMIATLDYYDWLGFFDKEKMEKLWLPEAKEMAIDPNWPDSKKEKIRKRNEAMRKPSKRDLEVELQINRSRQETMAVRAVDMAMSLEDPNDGLDYIFSRIPEHAPGREEALKRKQERLEKRAERLARDREREKRVKEMQEKNGQNK